MKMFFYASDGCIIAPVVDFLDNWGGGGGRCHGTGKTGEFGSYFFQTGKTQGILF